MTPASKAAIQTRHTAMRCVSAAGGPLALALSAALAATLLAVPAVADDTAPNPLVTTDPSGALASFATSGIILDPSNPFFQSLGTNGRACITCHVPNDAWTISPADVQRRFAMSDGLDPLFRTVDGSNSPNADVSTLAARQAAYSLLLERAVIRIGIGIPPGAEFDLLAVDDPYGFASVQQLSLFRRPLPSTNLSFLNSVMWDGRETLQKLLPSNTAAQNLQALQVDLMHQAVDATLGHAQAATPPTPAQQQQILNFELALFTAQTIDTTAGDLQVRGALGGPLNLSQQPFFVGINDLVLNPSTTPPTVTPPNPPMTLYSAWADPTHTPAQQAVARGQALFNTRPITISGVAGLNDALGLQSFQGTCTTCHNTPNVGNHSVAAPLNIGIADASRRTPDVPLYTLRNLSTGATVQTTDPGRALITGKWVDIGKFKGPILRGLAGRAPYFHNGSAASLDDVLDFYNTRFGISLTPQEHADLVAFLRAL
jgi:cytochrome c peroxidase